MVWATIKRRLGYRKGKAEVDHKKGKTSSSYLTQGLRKIFAVNGKQQQLLEKELEELLYTADLGPKVSERLLRRLDEMPQPWLRDGIVKAWMEEVCSLLKETQATKAHLTPSVCSEALQIVLLVGVNGVGKTTTAAKLANYYSKTRHRRVMLAAADTFRAAAGEQLRQWADRIGVPCVSSQEGADPAAVAFDAVTAARSRNCNVLLIDTGGRLHSNQNLMAMLQKMQRTIKKALAQDIDEVLLVLDATTGQNALEQAKQFNETIGLTGIVLTKVDSSAKGGALVGISVELGLPVTFVGSGEKLTDLHSFDAERFAAALFQE